MREDMLQLVDLSSWKVKELEIAGITNNRTFGVEIPRFSPTDIWWMPQEYAIELNLSLQALGLPTLNLTAPGVNLLPKTSTKLTRRHVITITVSDALRRPHEGWWKAAEAKIDTFPSSYRTALELQRDIEKAGLPDSSILQVSDKQLPIAREYRSFVADNKVMTTSIYLETLLDGSTVSVYDGLVANMSEMEQVVAFTANAIEDMTLPRGLTVDVAVLHDGSMAVLEYNPAWCSGWYECDLEQVEKTIQASFNETDPRWAYIPDPYMVQRISKRRRLPLSPIV